MNIEKLIEEMTIDEKIGQMSQAFLDESNSISHSMLKQIEEGEIGSVILSATAVAGNVDDGLSSTIVEDIKNAEKKSRHKIPVILGRDIIHGHKIIFPIPLAQAASWNMDLIEESAELTAREARRDGVEWTFAPMLDLIRDPRWGRVIESYGEDPYLGSKIAEAHVKGTEKVMLACAKHFVGYGAVEGGRDYSQSQISDYELYNMYLPAFRAAIDAGCSTVMNSFSAVNGVPCVANEELMRGVLKKDLGFGGFVISDWGSPKWLINHGVAENDSDCAELSVKAGIDMEMATDTYRKSLKQLVADGKISMDMIDDSVRRILRIKEKFAEIKPDTVTETALFEAAERISDETMILLKNNNDALPINKESKVLLIGPYADEKRALCGSWSGGGDYDKTITLYQGICEIIPKESVLLSCNDADYETALHFVQNYDVVVAALGEPAGVTGERTSMADIKVSQAQIDLLKKFRRRAKKLITVVFGGRALGLEEVSELSDAVLYAWHSGVTAGKSAAKILFGDVVPSGKTPVSFLHSSGQIPMYYNMPHLPIPAKDESVPLYYGEPIFPSYKDEYSKPLYPFGYGLSYTEFSYGSIKADRYSITVDELENGDAVNISSQVANVGNVDGKEVVQMYIHAKKSSVMRPMRELKGFEKVMIKHGEREEVSFRLSKKELGYYVNREFIVEKGEFDIYIGSSSYADNHVVIEII